MKEFALLGKFFPLRVAVGNVSGQTLLEVYAFPLYRKSIFSEDCCSH